MHDAYEVLPVLERLPLMIECIACYGETSLKYQPEENVDVSLYRNTKNKITVLVGTKPGHLLVYKVVREIRSTGSHIDVTLEKSNRSFSKRPIQQMFVCAGLKILISLSDASVNVHDLHTFQLITTLQKAKGASLFAADLEEQTSSAGEVAHELKLCVVVKRKLQFYFWKNRDFFELHADVVIPEAPKCLSWCRDTVCLGLKREYMLVKLKDSEPRELFPTGKLMEPVVGRLDSDQLIVMKDDNSVFVDCNGLPTYQQSFSWSDNPIFLESQPPYILAVLPKYVEVRTVEPKLFVQSIEFHKAKFLSCWNDWTFVSSISHIWLLQQRPISAQVDNLILEREFELALKLTKMSHDQDETEKMKQIRQIRTSLAFERFCQKRFDESLHIFADLRTDPVQVIGLYPNLLPSKYQDKLHYPAKLPDMSGTELESALNALIELLMDKRNETLKVSDTYIENTYPIVPGNTTVHSKRQLLQIIDTTLLKCYMKTNDALVAPLLRLPDNHCHIDEAERVLIKSGKHRELIELYKSKGLHRKALDLLHDHSRAQSNKHEAREDMVEYLQHIGREHIDLIFEFAPDLLKADPNNAIKIFTGDTAEVESLPKNLVFDFLLSISPSLVQAYLEHIIFALDDKTPEYHNILAAAYRDKVLSLMKEYQDTLPEDDQNDLSNAPIDLLETRKKLSSFLEHSTSYEPDRIIHGFPHDRLIEERALLYGRMGLHQKALDLYTHTLKDAVQAEEFCRKVYDQNPAENSEIFLCLLKIYLHPSSPDIGSTTADVDQPSPIELSHALRILHHHSSKIDPEKALLLLPASTTVSSISVFLATVLEKLSERLRHAQVLRSLLLSESQQIHEQRIYHEGRKCIISEERVCKVCRKKIGVSAFARYPDDVVVHYYCCKERKVPPSSG